jgi:hypothetical protein
VKTKPKPKIKEQPSFIRTFFQNDFFFFAILSIFCLILYWKPVTQAPMLNFDDRTLLLPMSQVYSISDYARLWNDNAILDLQPVRDLSYILEYRISDFTGVKIHPQFVNLILWLISIYLIYKITITQGFYVVESKLAVAFLAVHPIAVNSIAWSASRKHILSMLFISAATLLWLRFLSEKGFATETQRHRGRKIDNNLLLNLYTFIKPIGVIFLYLLSCLSQPINVGWFLWAGFIAKYGVTAQDESKLRFKKAIPYLAILSLIGLVTVGANLFYYSSERYANSLGAKFITEGFDVIGNRLLTFGRFFFQTVFPIQPSITSYDPTSLLAGIGILLLPVFCFITWKINTNKSPLLNWGLFTILPLLVVNGPSNQHFGWDTYLLTPLVGWTFILTITMKSLLERKILSEKSISILLLTVLTLFSIQTKISSDAWQDDESMWTQSVNTERTQASLAGFVKTNLSLRKNIHEMWSFVNELMQRFPNHPDIGYLLGRLIFEDNQLSLEEKKDLFLKYNLKSPWFIYYRAAFDASQRNFSEADNRLLTLFSGDKQAVLHFKDKLGEITASWYAMCVFAGNENCKEHIYMIRNSVSASNWSESQFRERLSSFGLNFEISK